MHTPLGAPTRRRRAARPVAPALLALGLGLVLSACSSGPAATGTVSEAGLPALPGGCAKTVTPKPPESIAVSLQKAGGGEIVEAAVCVNGQGPYPFAVATGAGSSVVSPGLVRSLHLPGGGGALQPRGVTCTATMPQTAFRHWSLGGLSLATQDLAVSSLPSLGLAHPPVGLLGSDVLSRFGAIRVDYHAKKLVLATGEEAAPARTTFILGQASTAPPADLVHNAHPAGTTLSVLESQTGTVVTAQVAFGKTTAAMTVDTGSASSSVSPTLQSALKLSAAGSSAPASGPGCRTSVPQYQSGSWTTGGVALPATALSSYAFAGPVNAQVVGAIGSDVLSSFGSVVLDYHGAHLWLGAG